MSSIIANVRHLMAVMQPQTGDRASGVATVTASGDDVTVPRSTYAIPVIGGKARADLVFKVGDGPNADKSWTATSDGVDVNFLSNIGGSRHNIDDVTTLLFDPPITGIDSVVVNGDFTGGANTTFLGGIKDMVQYEQLDGADPSLDLSRSPIKGFPGVVVTWQGSKGIEGAMPRGVQKSEETFTIAIITNRGESDHIRRQEGQAAMDALTSLLIDRKAVDGVPFSNPTGVIIQTRGRERITHKVHQKFYVYYIVVMVTSTFNQTDSRVYHNLELINMDILKPQDPALPNQGDLTIVDDVQIDMTDD